ncbi:MULTISPECIES: arginine--tRNA ligase [unclassified Lactococcus]|uniref:arginine--tRNA ligase n=1 Tax=unclassified Lactococcus TaxID=2643510 RepID=UPI0011C8FBC4|nr:MULTISPECIES: arginine--tRNA ligase [unclassified Lactococcus]MQW23034.1 arginine--tRNA ligase [Lactococcus sp. dk101]TXK44379.1 arginine--tRNA ligase [Lactococcus sp. dk310]TXK50189.1 arginine--tRNA ligase [Lactococcus sp. dk322]
MNEKNLVSLALFNALDGALELEQIEKLIEKPKTSELGDLAFPAFQLAKIMHKAPQMIAADVAEKIDTTGFEKVVATGPYVNFFLDKDAVATTVINEITDKENYYADQNAGNAANVTIDMSSPNIAKPFSIGHLRSTVIGDSLANIYQKMGYNPVRINHLGDWGKQFGMLITAYKLWGDEAAVKAHPIDELLKLYVRINAEAEEKPELDEEARNWFRKLENGDEEALALWKWFRDESLVEFKRIYDKLDVDFDSYNGEAFYNDKMAEVVEILGLKGLLKESQGATIVELEKYDLNPALIKKSDGATLYITRDLAAAIYRKRTYDFAKSLYVVGGEQTGHFKQLKAVLTEMGYEWAKDIEHVPFGLVTRDGKKLSTRKGNIIRLEPTIDEAVERALSQINAKNPDLANKETVAHQVGTGAIKFYDLKTDRTNGYDFNLEEMVSFEGETGPYVQYAYARIRSILRKANFAPSQVQFTELPAEAWEIVKILQNFGNTIGRAADKYEPSIIAKYAITLAQAFNKYYAHVRILEANEGLQSRLALANATAIVLKEALRLLGVEAPEEM